jgi:hypothetical protein
LYYSSALKMEAVCCSETLIDVHYTALSPGRQNVSSTLSHKRVGVSRQFTGDEVKRQEGVNTTAEEIRREAATALRSLLEAD